MLDWLNQYSGGFQTILTALMAFIWLAYLQLFLVSFRRQRRSMIMVEIGGGTGMNAQVYVGNLSFEPLYVVNIFVKVVTDYDEVETVITDRGELDKEELDNPEEITNQGPMKTADSLHVGSFGKLIDRVRRQSGKELNEDHLRGCRITVVAHTAATSRAFVAARRDYLFTSHEGHRRFLSDTLVAEQIRSLPERLRLKRRLEKRLLPQSKRQLSAPNTKGDAGP